MKKIAIIIATVAIVTFGGPAVSQDDLEFRVGVKPLTLDVHLHDEKYTYDSNWPVELEAARLTGISLNNVTKASTSNSQDAFDMLFASGDLPDIVGGNLIKSNANRYGQEGALIPLQDLIAEHAPNISALMKQRPEIFSSILAGDGNMYFVPYITDGKYGRAYFIRTDWLEKLGLEAPDNVEELHAVLTAFRNKDPNGNGRKDEVPAFFRDWEEVLRLVTLWDGRSTGSDTYHDFYVDNGEIKHGYTREGYREGLKHIAQWYKEGLIDSEIFTRGSRAREFLLSEDLGGFTHDWFASTASYNDSLVEKIDGFKLEALIPPASISGVRMEEHRRILVKPDGWAISAANEHPVETIKYMDFWFSEVGRRLANFGVEGQQYDLIDGRAIFKKDVLESDRPVNVQLRDVGAQVRRGFHQDYDYENQWTNKYALAGIDLYEQGDYLIDQFLGVSFNDDEQEVYEEHWINIRDYMLGKQKEWVLGDSDVEEEWDTYLEELDKLGINKVIKAMQSAYNRQYMLWY